MTQAARPLKRGDVYWCELEPPDKHRPVVILTRNSSIPYLTSVTVAPLTTRIRDIATQVVLETFDGVPERCAISLDNIQTVPKDTLGGFITSLSRVRLQELNRAIGFALELDQT
ncbi:MAG: type II toxin-antitoxin system PemK/MazF family toxin [Pleurocapsa sp. SU_196_0]|nr:type II toxin-antitoxin system PemK/MazF family toxin [Pleurocapsa sp. SU_196_0]